MILINVFLFNLYSFIWFNQSSDKKDQFTAIISDEKERGVIHLINKTYFVW